jgi:hypothetical protein
MHSDVHLRLHALRSAELHEEARAWNSARAARATRVRGHLRIRLGWGLVEVGLRLVQA